MAAVADALTADLDALFQGDAFDEPLVIHLGGFEKELDEWRSRIYFIS